MQLFFDFVKRIVKELDIDESHGLQHSKGTLHYANYLMKHMPNITEEERHMAVVASIIHDLCDSKYTDIEVSSKKIKDWLVYEMYWIPEVADALLSILQTMSYSKLKHKKDLLETPVFPDHGKWQRSYEIARHADLLESYVVARCVLFNRHKFPEKTEDEHWQRAEEIFQQRVFTYVENNWITLPAALAIIPLLEDNARNCLKERSMAWSFEKPIGT